MCVFAFFPGASKLIGMSEVLVIAGEASGDRAAALVVRALASEGVRAWGAGGPACRAAGIEVIADTTLLSAMGLGDVASRLPAIASAVARLFARARRAPPRAAVLADFAELNARLGRLLRARGVPVLRLSAPQVWAWRPGRLASLHGAFDRLAVLLPFEEALWRSAGHDARYVGHPSLEAPALPPIAARLRLGLPPGLPAIAVLPGSRAGEVRRLAGPLCDAAAALVAEGRPRGSCSRPASTRRAGNRPAPRRAHGRRGGGGKSRAGAAPLLGAFDISLTASGTATLEAALAAAAPVVAGRLDPLAYALARRVVRTPHIALPNVLLGRRAYPEVLQDEVTPARLAAEGRRLLGRREEALALAAELRAVLAPPSSRPLGTGWRSWCCPGSRVRRGIHEPRAAGQRVTCTGCSNRTCRAALVGEGGIRKGPRSPSSWRPRSHRRSSQKPPAPAVPAEPPEPPVPPMPVLVGASSTTLPPHEALDTTMSTTTEKAARTSTRMGTQFSRAGRDVNPRMPVTCSTNGAERHGRAW